MSADLAVFPPPAAAWRNPAAQARHLHPAALPRWRSLLGLRWQERLERVTEFSLAYHDARDGTAEDAGGKPGSAAGSAAAGELDLASRGRGTAPRWPRSRSRAG